MRRLVVLGFLAVSAMAQHHHMMQRAPVANLPAVELKGKIARVQVAPGLGMPFLEVEQNGHTVRVLLGSMRYLMEQNFNPKAGALVEVKGYRDGEDVMAAVVTLPAENKTLRLRDSGGWPVWTAGRRWADCCGWGHHEHCR